jgi:hypothetical protein
VAVGRDVKQNTGGIAQTCFGGIAHLV